MKKKNLWIIALVAIITIGIIGCDGRDTTTPETVIVTFNANGGSPTPSNQPIEKGKIVNEPQAPTKENYTLDGWYKEEALTNKWNFASDTVSANITLWAKWNEKQPNVTAIYRRTYYGFYLKSNSEGYGKDYNVHTDTDVTAVIDMNTITLSNGGLTSPVIFNDIYTDGGGVVGSDELPWEYIYKNGTKWGFICKRKTVSGDKTGYVLMCGGSAIANPNWLGFPFDLTGVEEYPYLYLQTLPE